jgi:hypothetical protein
VAAGVTVSVEKADVLGSAFGVELGSMGAGELGSGAQAEINTTDRKRPRKEIHPWAGLRPAFTEENNLLRKNIILA